MLKMVMYQPEYEHKNYGREIITPTLQQILSYGSIGNFLDFFQ